MPNIVEDVETEVQYMNDVDVQWISVFIILKGVLFAPLFTREIH